MNRQNMDATERISDCGRIPNLRYTGLLSLVIAVVALMMMPTGSLISSISVGGEVPISSQRSDSTHVGLGGPAPTLPISLVGPTIPNLVVGHSPGTNPANFGVLRHARYLGDFHPPLNGHSQASAQTGFFVGSVITPLGYTNGTAGWNGLDNNAPNNCYCTPPDTSGSAGAGYVFETVNAAGEIWTTSGTSLSSFTLQTLFNTTESVSDPNIHYDTMSGRWFAEIISVTNYGNVFLAVSTSSDPTGAWHNYLLNMPNHTGTSGDLPDQINVGVGANTISLSGNDFAGGSTFAGNVIFVVNKSQAVAGGGTPAYVIVGPWSSYISVHAAEMLSSSGTIYFLSSCAIGTYSPCKSTVTKLNYVTLQGAPPSTYKFTFQNFSTTSTQPGSPLTKDGKKVVTNDQRTGSAVWYKGIMWSAANDGACAGGVASCVHLWEFNTATSKVVQDFIWTPSGGLSAFYPAVTVDSNSNLGLLYSFAGSTAYPSLGITGEAASDTPGTMETPTTAKAGVADGSSATRFGDYSGAATDLSNNVMWGFGEWTGLYGCSGARCYEWDTWVQSFNFSGASNPSITSFTASPATIPLGGSSYLNVTATGGTPPYVYSYTGLPTGCTSSNTASLKCTPSVAGAFTVTATVTDVNAKTASASTSLTVTSSSNPSITSFTANPATILLGASSYLNVTATGGTLPYAYSYTGLPTGCTSANTASLKCTPTVTGSYAVMVTVTDAASKTASAAVSLTISPPSPSITSFTANPSTILLGASSYLNVTATGGTAPYTYSYSGLPAGCTSSNTASLKCTPTALGSYAILVTVTDANSKTASAAASLTISPPTPSITSFTASPSTIPLGGSSYLNVTATGGTLPYTYSYSGLPAGCTSSNTASLKCTPTATGSYAVLATVSDANGQTASKAASLTVSPPSPSITSFTASPASIPLGGSSYLNVTATGGTPPYVYSYSALPPGCTSSNTVSLKCTPTSVGTYAILATVTDANSKTASASASLTVTSIAPGPSISSFTASPATIPLGGSSYLNVTATGGTAPYTYSYSGLPAGCASSNTASLKCTPTTGGTFGILVTVTDANTKTASASTTLTITYPSPSITSFTASPASIPLGGTSYFNVTATGGTLPYTYSYSGLPSGCTSANTASLKCTPTAAGNYATLVTVTDANGKTASSAASLTVTTASPGPSITSFTASPATIPLGGSSYFNVTATGGTIPYTYSYSGLPAGCTSSNTVSLKCTPTATGSFAVLVTVTDANGKTATAAASLTVSPPSPSITSFTASPASIPLGGSSYLNVTATGGTAPYTYGYSALPAGCASANTASLKCTPTSAGTYAVLVIVTDVNGKTASASASLTVTSTVPGPSISSFTASPATILLGGSSYLNVTATGGTVPYTYSYSGLPAGCTSSNTASLKCTPTVSGTYAVLVTVTDANSKAVSAATSLVVSSPGPSITSFTAKPSTIPLGGSSYLNVTATGGTIPYTYSYSGLPAGCASSNTASLKCTPTAAGTFGVLVTVTDANGKTVSAAVSLTVSPPGPSITSFTASPASIPLGGSSYLNVTATSGTTPYTYSYSGLPAGCTSMNTASLKCTPTAAGTFGVLVTVTDANGKTASAATTLVVSPPSPSITSFKASPASIPLGGSSYLNVTATGGTLPYVYSYSGLPAGCASSNTASLKCTPTAAGTFGVLVTVTDANGKTASAATTLVVSPPSPSITSFKASPASIPLGGSSYLNVTATGGTAPYVYSYSALPPGCTSSNTASLKCTPTSVGTYAVLVTVTDANGKTASASASLTVTSAAPGPTISSFTASPATIPLGGSSYLNVTATGGTAPYTYSYSGLPAGCASSNTASLKCTPTTGGTFGILVTVTDANTKTASASTTLTITYPSPSITSFTASPASIPLGGSSYFNVTATGGTIPYTYSYSGLPAGCTSSSTATLLCTPTAAGTYGVLVTVTDSKSMTASAATSLTVSPPGPSISSFTASPSTVFLGGSSYLNVTAAGGTPPYAYNYSGLPPGCVSASVASLLCTATATGSFGVLVTVRDANGKTASAATSLTVMPSATPGPSITSFTASPATIPVGGTSYLNVTATGGTTPYAYSYSGLPPGCASANTASLKCTPTSAGTYGVLVIVTDANSKTASAAVSLTVSSPSPSIISFAASPAVIPLGGSSYLNVSVTGGTTPYSYSYSGLPAGCKSGNTAFLKCTPTIPGTFGVLVTVTDGNSKTASAATSLTVSSPSPVITAFTSGPPSIPIGGTTYFNVTVAGGTLPYTYSYSGLPAGCTSANLPSLPCTPTVAGTFAIQVTVTDMNSKTATQSTPLTVISATAPSVTSFGIAPDPVTVNTSTTFTVAVSGGTTPYTYVYSGLPAGCLTSNTNSLSCTPTALGSYSVTVTVTDVSGKTASRTATLAVVAVLTVTSFVPSPNPVSVNTATTLSVVVSGGSTPYSYAYTGLPAGCSTSNTNSLSCTPTAVGNYSVRVLVTDNSSRTASASATLTVTRAPAGLSITSYKSSPSTIPLGGTSYLNVTASGGAYPYTYSYSGLPVGCASSNTATLKCTPAAVGTYTITVTVKDNAGKTASSYTSLTVTQQSANLVITFTASPNNVTVNTSTTLNVGVTGGTAPYSYSYTFLPPGCSTTNTNALSCTPTQVGVYNVSVTVIDSGGHSASKTLTLYVVSGQSSAGQLWTSIMGWIILGLILIVVGVAAALVLLRRRRGKGVPPGSVYSTPAEPLGQGTQTPPPVQGAIGHLDVLQDLPPPPPPTGQ